MKKYLGVELGSTRIKGVVIDQRFVPVESGDFEWESTYDNGIWTYDLADAREGLCQVLSQLKDREGLSAAGISGMMHGYLAFDKDWNLLVPFRTWQNTITADAAEQLTELFQFNVPQRWSIAHLYQAILNGRGPCQPDRPHHHPVLLRPLYAHRRKCGGRGRGLRYVPHRQRHRQLE